MYSGKYRSSYVFLMSFFKFHFFLFILIRQYPFRLFVFFLIFKIFIKKFFISPFSVLQSLVIKGILDTSLRSNILPVWITFLNNPFPFLRLAEKLAKQRKSGSAAYSASGGGLSGHSEHAGVVASGRLLTRVCFSVLGRIPVRLRGFPGFFLFHQPRSAVHCG